MQNPTDTAHARGISQPVVVTSAAGPPWKAIHTVRGGRTLEIFEADAVVTRTVRTLVRASSPAVYWWRRMFLCVPGNTTPARAIENVSVVRVTWWWPARPSFVQPSIRHVPARTPAISAADSGMQCGGWGTVVHALAQQQQQQQHSLAQLGVIKHHVLRIGPAPHWNRVPASPLYRFPVDSVRRGENT